MAACQASNLIVPVRIRLSALFECGVTAAPVALDHSEEVRILSPELIGHRLTVGHAALDRRIGVRIPVPELAVDLDVVRQIDRYESWLAC